MAEGVPQRNKHLTIPSIIIAQLRKNEGKINKYST